jgi:two-component system CheB/CheR fusion protein
MAKRRSNPNQAKAGPRRKKKIEHVPVQTVEGSTDGQPTSSVSFDPDGISAVPFPIVAVGASAGGLEAFSQLLQPLGADSGMAIVLVQHLAPKNPSLLPELLAGQTRMPVRQVTDGTKVEADHVYVIPPDAVMTLQNGALRLTRRSIDHGQHTPIDTFFASVAEYAQSRAIGVILSGTATDGVHGIKAIKAAGGITFAQLPESARFDGMPRAAIATEMVDLVLEPAGIAAELLRIARHPYLKRAGARGDETHVSEEQLMRIFHLLRNATGVDFAQYKPPTIRRRLQRRMVLHKIGTVEHYLKFLHENPTEVHNLYQDILIHVTRFFREPESFDMLKTSVFPKIIGERKSDNPLRIWVPGCSTGEEPYSVAITLLEYLSEHETTTPIQVFATDLSESAIERARAGIYPESIAADVSPDRLRRFFTRTDGNYQISKTIRDLCVFARQDLTRDPPFSKLDLIVCRNVLIYLSAALQRKLMTVFHYALRSHGFLMLGHAETVGVHADLFAVADKKSRVYSKKAVEIPPAMAFPLGYKAVPSGAALTVRPEPRGGTAIHNEANRLLLDRYTPPGVIVDATLQIVQFHGSTGPFLEPAPGDASLHLLKMAREGLVYGLRTALRAARKSDAPVRREGMHVKFNGDGIDVDLEVVPLGPPRKIDTF